MSWANRRNCAVGVALLILVGCVPSDQFSLKYLQTNFGGDRVVAASLESVSESTQAGLTQLGMKVVATPQGNDVRLAATTPSGDQFALILMRVKTDKGEQTRVRLEGTSSNHEKILVNIFTQAERSAQGRNAAQK